MQEVTPFLSTMQHFLQKLQPKMFLFENVRGILSMREIFYKRDVAGNILYELKDVEGRESLAPRKKTYYRLLW